MEFSESIKVSIIIPVYNVEKYIVRCLASVIKQTYRNLEVVLVDDRSPDNSMSVAKKYITKHFVNDIHFVYLYHDINLGLSAARNTGLRKSSGDYVYFLDSDDELEVNCIEVLVKPLLTNPVDFVIGDYTPIGFNTIIPPLRISTGYYSGDSIISHFFQWNWYVMAWNKLCNKKFLLKYNLFFKENLIHEDDLWSFKLACCSADMFVVKEKTYIYYSRPKSIMSSLNYEKEKKAWTSILTEIRQFQQDKKMGGFMLENHIEKCQYTLYTIIVDHLHETPLVWYNIIRKIDCRSNYWRFKSYSKSLPYLLTHIHYFLPIKLGYFFWLFIHNMRYKKN